MSAHRNLWHVMENTCTDPDCELHNPNAIETQAERLTAKAWFLAGIYAHHKTIEQVFEASQGDHDAIEASAIAGAALMNLHDLRVSAPDHFEGETT